MCLHLPTGDMWSFFLLLHLLALLVKKTCALIFKKTMGTPCRLLRLLRVVQVPYSPCSNRGSEPLLHGGAEGGHGVCEGYLASPNRRFGELLAANVSSELLALRRKDATNGTKGRSDYIIGARTLLHFS